MTTSLDRRQFLLACGGTVGYFFTADAVSAARAAKGPNDKIHFAGIGVGGKGSSDIDQAGKLGEVVAICDIDDNTLNNKAKKFPNAKKYNDFRILLEEMEKQIDAVVVSTPDHTHAHPSIMAMQMKKAVYCQKPLCHSVWEARTMREVARKYGVATQMGNQGTAESGLRRAVELVQAGVIGPVREVHVWTNRPIWPQAPDVTKRPEYKGEVPKHIHWDLFLGPAPERPYAPGYHPFSWRGWLDFGTGALGDMACHTANMAFMALKLSYPTSVVAEAKDVNSETYPTWARVMFEFPARGEMPPLKFFWYEGREGGRNNKTGKRQLPPDELLAKILSKKDFEDRNTKLVGSGSILVGDKGILYSPNDYGASFQLLPKEQFAGVKNLDRPEQLPINGKGDQGMKNEWVEAIRGGPAPMSNFDYAAMLTETILLGNIAIRLTGQRLEWDGPSLRFTNSSEANQLVRREYRKGWELKVSF